MFCLIGVPGWTSVRRTSRHVYARRARLGGAHAPKRPAIAGCLLPAGRHPGRHLGQRRARQGPAWSQDVSDSAWLAQLGECGLVKASFVPPEPAGTCVT